MSSNFYILMGWLITAAAIVGIAWSGAHPPNTQVRDCTCPGEVRP